MPQRQLGHLIDAWLRTVRRTGARGDVSGAGAALLRRYAESHRHYHTLVHLDAVLRTVEDLADHAADADVVRIAAWYHDAVYDPGADDNEERSARLAEQTLARLHIDPALVAEVSRLVRLTADHRPRADDRNGAVLCDADLAVLASSPLGYGAYTAAVRAEFGHVDDAAFTAGRARVVRELLALPALFTTPYAAQHWEDAARQNLRAELVRLEGGSLSGPDATAARPS